MLANSYRELQELSRDPIRLTLAGLGSVILMIIMGYGITLDVEHLKFAVLDRDQTTVSRDYADQHRRLEPVLHRAAAGRRLRGTRPPHAVGRTQHGRRDPAPASVATWSDWSDGASNAGARSVFGSTAPCRSAPKRSAATCRGCTSTGCNAASPAYRGGSTP